MFSAQQFLPEAVLDRADRDPRPGPRIRLALRPLAHSPRPLAPGGKLNILAADHPARRVTKVGDNPLAMCDRHEYLARILRVLAGSRVDGVMATMDILDDLLIVDGLLREAGGEPLLDGKLAIASLNRGGLAGSAWELNDPVTGPSPAACQELKLDGVKVLLRVDDTEPASLADPAGLRAGGLGIVGAGPAGLPGAAPGHADGKGLRRGEDRRGLGAAGGSRIRARRQQPLSVAEAALLRGLPHGGAIHHAADSAAGR